MNRDHIKNKHCKCYKIDGFIHDLAQSLMIINTYINGCQQRIKLNSLTEEQLLAIFDKIKVQTELVSGKSRCLLTKKSWPID